MGCGSYRGRSYRQFKVGSQDGRFAVIAILAASIVPRIPAFSLFQSTPMLRVMSLNTYFGGAVDTEIADIVNEVNPDVLILAETNPLEASAVARATDMRVMTDVDPGDGADGTTMLAKTIGLTVAKLRLASRRVSPDSRCLESQLMLQSLRGRPSFFGSTPR